jgi:N utilization substance protein A
MQAELPRLIEQVAREKNLSLEKILNVIRESVLAAARKRLDDLEAERDLECNFDPETGQMELFEYFEVVDGTPAEANHLAVEEAIRHDPEAMVGDEIGVRIELEDFGRIAASTAKQVLMQQMREAERSNVYDEYHERVSDLITGIVRRFEKGAIIVDLGKTEGVIPVREQIPAEHYRPGDRIQALVLEVGKNPRGPQIVLSRTSPDFVKKLFELEVPEIYENIVRIEAVVREPGQRAKIAVSSRDPDVDPVGACVGMRGSRVQNVVQELRGEKIDIIPWSPSDARFVCAAISPATVLKVIQDERNHSMELIVPDEHLSLAIGRRGQNVRLASKLSGWRLDILSEGQLSELNERAYRELARVEVITEMQRDVLVRYGFRTLADVADAEIEEIMDTIGVEEEHAGRIIDAADEVLTDDMRREIDIREDNDARRAQGLPLLRLVLGQVVEEGSEEEAQLLGKPWGEELESEEPDGSEEALQDDGEGADAASSDEADAASSDEADAASSDEADAASSDEADAEGDAGELPDAEAAEAEAEDEDDDAAGTPKGGEGDADAEPEAESGPADDEPEPMSEDGDATAAEEGDDGEADEPQD